MEAWETRGLTQEFYEDLDRDQLSGNARHVKMCLMHFTDAEGKNACPSIQRLCRMAGRSERLVRKVLRELEDKGHLKTEHQKGKVSIYQLVNNPGTTCQGKESIPAQMEKQVRHKLSRTPAQIVRNPGTACRRSVKDQVKDQVKDLKEREIPSSRSSTPKSSNEPASLSLSKPLLNQKRGDLHAEVEELARRYPGNTEEAKSILPQGDYFTRVEQALDKFGFEACLQATEAYYREIQQTKSVHKRFWYAFPALRKNNEPVTNRLDEGRFLALVEEGRPPPKAQTIDRPKAPNESDLESKRLDNLWIGAHGDALSEAQKQNKSPEEAENYAKEQANKQVQEDIDSEPCSPEYAREKLREIREAFAQHGI